jgi:luciferase-like monooxygenase
MATRRSLLHLATTISAVAGTRLNRAFAQQGDRMQTVPTPASDAPENFRRKMVGYMLAHEQFPVPELVQIGKLAAHSGFHLLATSDHLQPWQANQEHSGDAWVTLGALGGQSAQSWMGTTVTCPTFRYNPAVVAQAFASLGLRTADPAAEGDRRVGGRHRSRRAYRQDPRVVRQRRQHRQHSLRPARSAAGGRVLRPQCAAQTRIACLKRATELCCRAVLAHSRPQWSPGPALPLSCAPTR